MINWTILLKLSLSLSFAVFRSGFSNPPQVPGDRLSSLYPCTSPCYLNCPIMGFVSPMNLSRWSRCNSIFFVHWPSGLVSPERCVTFHFWPRYMDGPVAWSSWCHGTGSPAFISSPLVFPTFCFCDGVPSLRIPYESCYWGLCSLGRFELDLMMEVQWCRRRILAVHPLEGWYIGCRNTLGTKRQSQYFLSVVFFLVMASISIVLLRQIHWFDDEPLSRFLALCGVQLQKVRIERLSNCESLSRMTGLGPRIRRNESVSQSIVPPAVIPRNAVAFKYLDA